MLMIRIVVIRLDQEEQGVAGEADLEINQKIIKRDDTIVLNRLPQEENFMKKVEDENLHIPEEAGVNKHGDEIVLQ